MSELVPELDPTTFDHPTAAGRGPVLVDFWGYGCPPCDMLAPMLEQIARSYEGRLQVVKVNANDWPDLAARLGVISVPTLFFYIDGEIRERVTGLYPLSMLREMIDHHLAPRSHD